MFNLTAAWYPVKGGMQDYNFWSSGCFELTVEISCCKYPPASQLRNIWLDNRKALVEYMKLANTGVRGVVTYQNGLPAKNITGKIDSREPYFKTNKNGEYYRILLPGKYNLTLMLNCTTTVYQTSVTIANSLVVLNITLPVSVAKLAFNLNKSPVFCVKNVITC